MTRDKLWNERELHWIWLYQAATAVGVAYPLFWYLHWVAIGRTELSNAYGFVLWMLSYFLLLGLSALSLRVFRPKPLYMLTLEASRLAIPSINLFNGVRLLVARPQPLHVFPLQELTMLGLWWSASLTGLIYTFVAWRMFRRYTKHDSLSHIHFQTALELWPVHLATMAKLRIDSKQGVGKTLLAYAQWVLSASFYRLGLYLGIASRNRLAGEPCVRALTPYGWKAVGTDLTKDPDSTDYPPVSLDEVIATPSTHIANRQDFPQLPPDSQDSLSLVTLDSDYAPQADDIPRFDHIPAESHHVGPADPVLPRRFRPRYLCVLDETAQKGYRVEVASEGASLGSLQYVFVSYTRLQFPTDLKGLPKSTISGPPASANNEALISMAIHAATKAGVAAFWIDFECLEPDVLQEVGASRNITDVYQICDIVRGSYCMAIAVGPSASATLAPTAYESSERRRWLHQYGDRLWTLPEALLCPSNHGVPLYFATPDGYELELIEKRNLAERIWSDAATTRSLLEHYEGTLPLSQIEFISVALQSLQRRQTKTRMPADIIYALMGLLRQRVPVREEQSAFEAFARLSLANDSQRLLERLFCIRNPDASKDWHNLTDIWNAHLRDIEPGCDVVGVGAEDTVHIANLHAAIIHWAPFPAVRFELTRPSIRPLLWRWQRNEMASVLSLYFVTWLLAIGHLTVIKFYEATDGYNLPSVRMGCNVQLLFVLVLAAVSVISSMWLPSSIRRIYTGEIKNVEARFLGLAGIPDLGLVEEMLFGCNCGRLAWSKLNPRDTAVAHDDASVFTLIDTWLMTANTFHASTRPSIVAVAGKHRGVLRTMLCSYDGAAGVYYREQVIRMDEKVLKRMGRMETVRFSLQQKPVFRDEGEEFEESIT